MTSQGAIAEQFAQIGQIGKAALNVRYPNEFELYLCALELTDQDGITLRYFVFPVMPSSIDESLPQLNNVKKTAAGVTSLSSPTFNPTTINLQGTFGRKLKVVVGVDSTELLSAFTVPGASNRVTSKSILGGATSFFDNRIKTGYGCIKILQDIIEQSQQVDEKGARRLIFYNPALGNSYLVKAESLRFSQSVESSNMIWNYTLPLKSIAPLSAIMTAEQQRAQRMRLNTTGYAQVQANRLLNGLSNIIGKGIGATKGYVAKEKVIAGRRDWRVKKALKDYDTVNQYIRKWI